MQNPNPNPQHQSRHFPTHDLGSAPAESRPALEATRARFGFIPLPTARHATAPAVLEGFGQLLQTFDKTSLSPLEREALALALAGKLDCKLCRDLHRRSAVELGASNELVSALVARSGIPEPKLSALVHFTERVVDTRGAVSDSELEQFLEHGYTPRHALEVVVGVATYTLSIYANRMTRSETIR
jgi:AhpD family alkylhydroperoxidase